MIALSTVGSHLVPLLRTQRKLWLPYLVLIVSSLVFSLRLPVLDRHPSQRYHLEQRYAFADLHESPHHFQAATAQYQIAHLEMRIVPQTLGTQ